MLWLTPDKWPAYFPEERVPRRCWKLGRPLDALDLFPWWGKPGPGHREGMAWCPINLKEGLNTCGRRCWVFAAHRSDANWYDSLKWAPDPEPDLIHHLLGLIKS